MNIKITNLKQVNKIIEFRQAIHANGFGKQRDALSEALDATCLTGAILSFPLLSLPKGFHRQWHSLYKAIERGTLDDEWLNHYLAQQAPQELAFSAIADSQTLSVTQFLYDDSGNRVKAIYPDGSWTAFPNTGLGLRIGDHYEVESDKTNRSYYYLGGHRIVPKRLGL